MDLRIAAQAIRGVLAGGDVNGYQPEQLGEWLHIYEALSYADPSARPAVFRSLDQGGKLTRLLSIDIPPSKPLAPGNAPALPAEATAVYAHAAPCAAWLDEYIAYALEAAPMGPRSFHELAGLFAASLAIARRLVLPVSIGDIYPNIFALWIGDPAIYSKTSALKALIRLVREAELRHLLLPERLTPETLMLQYSLSIPTTLDNWQPEGRAQWLAERAYAAQRGWLLDEAARLFASLKQDYNTGLLGLLLQLYDCPDEKSEETIGRGRVIVNNTYMSFFGVATPNGMAEHFSNRALWENGLWSRFALVMPDQVPPWHFLGEYVPIPPNVLRHYRALFDLFPDHAAELIEDTDAKRKMVKVYGISEPSKAILAPGVRVAWEAYSKATRYDMLNSGTVEKALYGSYGRFGTHAIKVAMLLAAMDAEQLPVVVELRHWVRAQQIVEGWRAGLHRLWVSGVQTEEARDSDRLMKLIREGGERGVLPRDVYRPLGIKAADANAMLAELEAAGQIEKVPGRGENGRAVIYWRAVPALSD